MIKTVFKYMRFYYYWWFKPSEWREVHREIIDIRTNLNRTLTLYAVSYFHNDGLLYTRHELRGEP